jgi:hypothetical protein
MTPVNRDSVHNADDGFRIHLPGGVVYERAADVTGVGICTPLGDPMPTLPPPRPEPEGKTIQQAPPVFVTPMDAVAMDSEDPHHSGGMQ